MKYKLIIEGIKAEIEEAKKQHADYLDYRILGRNVEFKVVESKYRVKTLVELVTEYGEEVMVAGGYIYINGWGCSADVLGKFYSNKEAKSTWGEVFLTVSD